MEVKPPASIPMPNFEQLKLYRAVVYLQRLIRGRAVQTMMHLNRLKNLDSITFIRTSLGIVEEDIKKIELKRLTHVTIVRKYELVSRTVSLLTGVLNQAQGAVVSCILDFTSKELQRLEDERNVFLFATAAHKVRWSKESKEAGLRQKELRRRRQQQEMTQQIAKTQELVVDEFLHDMVDEALAIEAEERAREAAQIRADQQEPRFHEEDLEAFEREILSARLLYSHMVPEAEKLPVREKLEELQEHHRRDAYRAIFRCDEFESDVSETEKKIRLERMQDNDEILQHYPDIRTESLGVAPEKLTDYLLELLQETEQQINAMEDTQPGNVKLSTINIICPDEVASKD